MITNSLILSEIQKILPSAQFAPEESWITDDISNDDFRNHIGRSSKGKAVHFDSISKELTIFIKAKLIGQRGNIVSRIEHALERKFSKELTEGKGKGIIDVRLFRTDSPLNKGEE